jgi:hypothetical protein
MELKIQNTVMTLSEEDIKSIQNQLANRDQPGERVKTRYEEAYLELGMNKSRFYLDFLGNIIEGSHDPTRFLYSGVNTRWRAESILAFMKLSVIVDAANKVLKAELHYTIALNNETDSLYLKQENITKVSPLKFYSEEKARESLILDEDLWRRFLIE